MANRHVGGAVDSGDLSNDRVSVLKEVTTVELVVHRRVEKVVGVFQLDTVTDFQSLEGNDFLANIRIVDIHVLKDGRRNIPDVLRSNIDYTAVRLDHAGRFNHNRVVDPVIGQVPLSVLLNSFLRQYLYQQMDLGDSRSFLFVAGVSLRQHIQSVSVGIHIRSADSIEHCFCLFVQLRSGQGSR